MTIRIQKPKIRNHRNYMSIHRWIERHFEKSNTCEHCGKSNLYGRQIHWANIDHKYSKDRKDYLRLCPKCHLKFDMSIRKMRWKNKKSYNISQIIKLRESGLTYKKIGNMLGLTGTRIYQLYLSNKI